MSDILHHTKRRYLERDVQRKREPSGKMDEAFLDEFEEIQRRAKAVGMTMKDLCVEAGVARATPARWEKETPLTIAIIDKMAATVAAKEAQLAQQ